MLSGCLYGQNQQFFEYAGETGAEGGSAIPGGNGGSGNVPTAGETPIPTATPSTGETPVPSVTPAPTMTPTPTSTPSVGETPTPTPTATPPQVCDPFDGGSDGSDTLKNGIKGRLYSYEDSALRNHPYHGVSDFFRWGTEQNADLYLSSLFTPTRAFDSGFMTSDGAVLTKSNGDPLFEYFALKLTGGIQLAQGNSDRLVQFAILSDDGSKLRMLMANPDDAGVTVVNNDGDHPTQMGCSTTPVLLSANSRVPFELDYYQGPRYHIALILLWREWTPDLNANDPWCNQSGNDLFFDSTQTPSAPQSAWNDLSNRWQVVPSNVFYIDGFGSAASDPDNPCK